ncbi:MAG: hypothetical protein NWP47_03060 [Rickettsiaceae bacterium]|nr:hypothetical protein [Rickettsiaceae bacterium]
MIEISKPKGFIEIKQTEEEMALIELQRYIHQNINSKELDLSDRNIDDFIAQQIAPSIKECTQLEELNLNDNNISTQGIKAITESISSKNLKVLLVNDNYINDAGVQYIADLMLKQKNLEFLTISHLNINEPENCITNQGAKILAKSIEQAPMLHTIILSENSIKNDGLKAIIEAINIHNSVIDLQVDSNDIDDLSESAEALKNNRSLKKIDFSANNLGDEGAKILSTILEIGNINLAELILINCEIKDEGVRYLASALKKNDTLESLFLESNEIKDQGAEYLATMLETNNALVMLYLNNNQITNIGAEFFIKVSKVNITIHFISLDFNKISDELLQVIDNSLNTVPENLVQEEIEFNNKRTIDELYDDITQEELPNKKIKLEDTNQSPIQTELVGDASSINSCVSDLELE